jgi:DNA end-binding protein Ku
MALFTLRAAEEVRVPQFPEAEGELDHETVGIAKAIIAQRICTFDPTTYRDRYQEALRELIEAKMKGRSVKPREVSAPRPVIDLTAALKRSLARERPADRRALSTAKKANKPISDRRQQGLLLPVSGERRPNEEASPQSASPWREAAEAGLIPRGFEPPKHDKGNGLQTTWGSRLGQGQP